MNASSGSNCLKFRVIDPSSATNYDSLEVVDGDDATDTVCSNVITKQKNAITAHNFGGVGVQE